MKNKINNFFKEFRLVNFVFLTIAGFINAVGVSLFLTPWSLLDGGISGTSFLLFRLSSIPMPIFLICLNVPFFLLALKKMGYKTIIYSLYAISMYALAMFLYQSVFKLCGDDFMTSPFVTSEYDIILASIFGGLISGIGSGLTIRFGGAMDGIEVLGVMVSKKLNLTIGQFVMIYNVIIYILAGFILKNFQSPLYSIVAYALGLKAVDFIVEGLDKAKAAIIITDSPSEVAKAISQEMQRGITMLKARGYYSRGEKGMLYCVVNRFEINQLKNIIHSIDNKAFVSINEVSEIMGSNGVKFKPKFKHKSISENNIQIENSDNNYVEQNNIEDKK